MIETEPRSNRGAKPKCDCGTCQNCKWRAYHREKGRKYRAEAKARAAQPREYKGKVWSTIQASVLTGFPRKSIEYRCRIGAIDGFRESGWWCVTEKGLAQLQALKPQKREHCDCGTCPKCKDRERKRRQREARLAELDPEAEQARAARWVVPKPQATDRVDYLRELLGDHADEDYYTYGARCSLCSTLVGGTTDVMRGRIRP